MPYLSCTPTTAKTEYTTPVRRRLPSLPQHASQGRGHHSRPSLHLCYRHQRLDDGKPTAIKPHQDPGYVAGFKRTVGQDRRKRNAAVVNSCDGRRPRRCS